MNDIFTISGQPEIKIVSMLEFEGKLYVATERQIFILVDDKLYPVMFATEEST